MNEEAKFPPQPLHELDGVRRFKANAIVMHLLNHAEPGLNLDTLDRLHFEVEDRRQFAQLIGYTLTGYGALSYVNADEFNRVQGPLQTKMAAKIADDFGTTLATRLADKLLPTIDAMLRETAFEAAIAVEANVGETLAAVEKRMILATLAHFHGHRERTAATLGVSAKTLYNRLMEYGAGQPVGESEAL